MPSFPTRLADMSWKRYGLLPLLAATVVLQSSPALAQTYPSRPVRVMVGFAPGGPHDIIARAYGARLAETFGQPFVVENRTSAGGNLALAAPPGVPATSVKELIALARAQPGKLSYASSGNGSSLHLAAELFKQMTSVDLVHVPYKGAAPAMTDLVSGQVDMSFAPVANVVPFAKAGKLRLLALTGARHSAFAPGTPTLAESGLPGFDVWTWYAILVTAG